MTVDLAHPLALERGQGFAIREGGGTVGSGTVTKINKQSSALAEREGPRRKPGAFVVSTLICPHKRGLFEGSALHLM
ncbi:hypothetical protein LGT39_04880 [Demequina sp. TTPB684]|nr:MULTISPECIES: hypothetical protein [unclassified Demequina]MCB2412184.1 hypothetical protein [Demequina sp. TTPB684]UPU88391.1 hypothetical protein LGT36_000240 [Demequina sp. TMPB413]